MLSSDSRVERAVSVSSMRSTKVPLFLRACHCAESDLIWRVNQPVPQPTINPTMPATHTHHTPPSRTTR